MIRIRRRWNRPYGCGSELKWKVLTHCLTTCKAFWCTFNFFITRKRFGLTGSGKIPKAEYFKNKFKWFQQSRFQMKAYDVTFLYWEKNSVFFFFKVSKTSQKKFFFDVNFFLGNSVFCQDICLILKNKVSNESLGYSLSLLAKIKSGKVKRKDLWWKSLKNI